MAKRNPSTRIGAGLSFWLLAVEHATRIVFITVESHDIRRAVRFKVDELLNRGEILARMPTEHLRQLEAFASYARATSTH